VFPLSCGCAEYVSKSLISNVRQADFGKPVPESLWRRKCDSLATLLVEANFFRTLVLENMLDERSQYHLAAPVAFFYCARNSAELERSDPREVLCAILKQLCYSAKNGPIRELVVNKYNRLKEESGDYSPRPLGEKDCLTLILMLTADNPATIVIDALDECDPKTRYKLLSGLRTIVRESANLVKIFVSSRDNRDIISQLDDMPTISINASDNSEDIKRFVKSEVGRAIDERRLLYGKVETLLRARIIGVLTAGAQGM